jgi:hypothetical protein
VANWIEAVPEPESLILGWQAPDPLGDRFRWAVGVLERSVGGGCLLRYLRGADFARWNRGRAFEDMGALGYRGYPAFRLDRHVHTDNVLSAFMRRLPARSRPDFEEYKRQFRLPLGLDLSDFALLGQTEAKLPSDGFSLVDPLDGGVDRRELLLEVAGHRYYAGNLRLAVGDQVSLEPEPSNEQDPQAVAMRVADRTIGYVNRLQTAAFQRWPGMGPTHGQGRRRR